MMMVKMSRLFRITAACLALACAAWPAAARATAPKSHPLKPEVPQDTGFLNRRIVVQGTTYHFQVYLPEEWRRDDGKQWPIILALHGRGERGSEGMWQTQVGIAEAVRNHPDRWPFVIVMPQCPQTAHWTDPAMLDLAMASLEQESAEFHGDPSRTYLTGLSLGGYGAWELARLHSHRWAAIVIAAGGVFWSYEPDRWQEVSVLPAEYARAVGPHARLALPWQPRQRGAAATKRTDVRRFQSSRRRYSTLGLSGAEARLLDSRLRRARTAALAVGASPSNCAGGHGRAPRDSGTSADHQPFCGPARQPGRRVPRTQRACDRDDLPPGRSTF